MIYENDKFTDEKKIKHPKPPDKICKVDEDSKPEIASQALSKPLFQPISNKYKDNVDPTKNLRCFNRVKRKTKEAEDYISHNLQQKMKFLLLTLYHLPLQMTRLMKSLLDQFESYLLRNLGNLEVLRVT